MRQTGRLIARLAFLLSASAAALAHFAWLRLRHGRLSLRQRARWLHDWCAFGVPKLGVHVSTGRLLPDRGLLVSNHLSYLDILALSALAPCVFVAKREVRGWPLFGLMARLAGAVFVDRNRPMRAPQAVREIERALAAGALVVLFPEGTTSDGASVLPFRSAFFQAAVNARAPITAAHLSYSLADGDAATEVCWWGEAEFLPHLLNLLGKRRIEGRLQVAWRERHFRDRKLAAAFIHREVLERARLQSCRKMPSFALVIPSARRLSGAKEAQARELQFSD